MAAGSTDVVGESGGLGRAAVPMPMIAGGMSCPLALPVEMRGRPEVSWGSMADGAASLCLGARDNAVVTARAVVRPGVLAIAGPAKTPLTARATALAAMPTE